ncbi:MAG: hypothetical protein ACRCXQ_09830 [Vagococcus fluvialis]
MPNFHSKAILAIGNKSLINPKTCVLILKTNFDLPKVEFLYRTKYNFLKDYGIASQNSVQTSKFKRLVEIEGFYYNYLTILDNEDIDRRGMFTFCLLGGKHFSNKKGEKIVDIRLRISTTRYIKVNFAVVT